LDFFGKLGIKYFALKYEIPYDYVLGIDVGYGESYTSKVAGCVTLHTSEGELRNIIPVAKEMFKDSEKARINAILEEIESKKDKYGITFEGKKVLILRDGRLFKGEIEIYPRSDIRDDLTQSLEIVLEHLPILTKDEFIALFR